MLTISHIKAHLPSKNCQLTFMLRRRTHNNKNKQQQQKPSQIPLTEDYIDIDINCTIQLGDFIHCQGDVQLCAIAILDNSVDKDVGVGNGIQGFEGVKVCVGIALIDVSRNVEDEGVQLGGISGQDGYIVYSVMRDQKLQSAKNEQQNIRSSQPKLTSEKPVPPQSRGFIKYKNSSSGSSHNDNHQQSFESRSGSESPFRKNKFPQHLDVKSDEYSKLLDQLYHDILQQQLFNQRAWNKIQANQIFQLRFKQRIEAILNHNYPL